MAGEEAGWTERLARAGLLRPTGETGLYSRSGRFEAIVSGVERAIAAAAVPERPEVRRFAPVMAIDTLLRTGYPRSFPDLIGTVSSFTGGDADHAALLGRLDAGGDWQSGLAPAGTALCSAACQPLYPTLSGTLTGPAQTFDVYGWVYRHEPSDDPARQQAFRQYELVCAGSEEAAATHADLWRERGAAVLGRLGLDTSTVPANDPFFGRAGRLLASSQRQGGLKFELVAATGPSSPATAVASVNCHREHFGEAFSIHLSGGGIAHTACIGFGVERIALALLWAHGLDPAGWPGPVRDELGLT